MMGNYEENSKWLSFDHSIGDGSITTAPFSLLNNDAIDLILIHVLNMDMLLTKTWSLVCKTFHSRDMLKFATTRLDPEKAATMLIMMYGSPVRDNSGWKIADPWLFKDPEHEEVRLEWLAELLCRYKLDVWEMIYRDTMFQLIPMIIIRPKRLLALLETIDLLSSELSKCRHLKKLLTMVFDGPALWKFMEDPQWESLFSSAALKVLSSAAVTKLLKPSVIEVLKSGKVDSSLEAHAPLFD